jgi:two-component system NtrC family sensor kinase
VSAEVLIIDDEQELLDLVAGELDSSTYTVRTTRSGDAALALVRESEFEAVVLDIKLPDLDGLQVLRAIRDRAPETQVIILTGYASLETAIECLRAGAFDFIEKPFQMGDLSSTLARAVDRRRQLVSTALYEACQAVFGARDVERLPEVIVEVAMKALGADDVSLMLPDPQGRLYVAHSHDLSARVRDTTRLLLGERIAGRVAVDRKPALLQSDVEEDPRFASVESHGRVRSSIVYPLVSGERLVGVLNLNRLGEGRPFQPSDLHRAAVLASQVVLALENARLVRQLVTSERLAAVGQLAAGIAHEINNPVCYVLTNLQDLAERVEELRTLDSLLARGAGEAALQTCWEQIGASAFTEDLGQAVSDAREGATRIRDIVRDMRSLARSDEEQQSTFDLNEAIRSAVRVAAAEIRRRAMLVIRTPGEQLVVGNPGRMSQVFVNLLVNAAQAIAEVGGEGHHITVTSRAEGNTIIVDVSDTGPGIAQEHVSRIFEPFFTTKPAGSGTGLGLPISREIVQRHGGEIHVRSEVARGTTFTVTLPSARAHAAPRSKGTSRRIEPEGSASAPTPVLRAGSIPPPKPRILFIDDEGAIRRSYQRSFGRDHDITLASGGAEALEILSRTQDFELVVCDLLMPGITGMDVYRQACARFPQLQGRFVFVTGGLMQREVRSFLSTVGNQVIEKPFDFNSLREIIAIRTGKENERPAARSSSMN